MKWLLLILMITIADAQQISPDQNKCYTLARLNTIKGLPGMLNGMWACCKDCNPTCSNPCTSGGTGSTAFLQNNAWNCFACPTTTSTSTSTTTTLPSSNFFLWEPTTALATTFNGTPYPSVSNTLRCNAWVPTIGITNATALLFDIESQVAPGDICGMAIYNFDGSSRIISTGGQDCSVTGIIGVTGVTFSLTGGTKYQVCTCSNINSNPQYSTTLGGLFSGGAGNEILKLANSLSVPIGTTAAHACTNGSPPLTTGILTGDITSGIIYAMIGTATP